MCVFFMILIQLEEEEPAGVVISIDSLLSLFKQAATVLQLQLCNFSNLLTDKSDYRINLVFFTPPAEFMPFLSNKETTDRFLFSKDD